MNRLIKAIVVGFVIASLLPYGSSLWAVVDHSAVIDVTATVSSIGSTTLTVTNMDGAVNFDPNTATLAVPWVKSDGYVRVQYSSTRNVSYVGVRIVSRNYELVEDVDGDSDIDADDLILCVAPSYVDSDNDAQNDDKSYSGMIFASDLDEETAGEDPSKRATLAWQVFSDPQASITVPTSSVTSSSGGTVVVDNDDPASTSSVGPWDAAWAYIADVSDDNFVNTAWSAGDPADPDDDGPAYSIIASGITEANNGYLAQHPRVDDTHPARSADGDIAVYLAARFASTNWGSPANPIPLAYVLPAGSYKVKLYVELIYDD